MRTMLLNRCLQLIKEQSASVHSGKGLYAFERDITYRHIHVDRTGSEWALCTCNRECDIKAATIATAALLVYSVSTCRGSSFEHCTTQQQQHNQTQCLRQVFDDGCPWWSAAVCIFGRSLTRLALPVLLPVATTGTPPPGEPSRSYVQDHV